MTNEEVGAYLRLLYYHFHNGSIPADQARAGYITGERLTDSVWAKLGEKFVAQDAPPGRLVNVRMSNVRAVAEAAFKRRSEANRLNGQKGGLARGVKLRTQAGRQIATESLPNRQPIASERQATVKHIEEKKDTEEGTKTVTSTPNSQGTKNLRARRSRRVPEEWKISDALGKWVQSKFPGVHVDTLRVWTAKQLERFRNYEFASPRSDWDATFRNWVLTCIDKGAVPSGSPRSGGDEEKAWQDTLKTAALFGMTKDPDESREAFAQRVTERNQRRLDALERQRRG